MADIWDKVTIPSATSAAGPRGGSATALKAGGHDNTGILDWANEVSKTQSTKAATAKAVTDNPTQHVFNPLTQNSQYIDPNKTQPGTSVASQILPGLMSVPSQLAIDSPFAKSVGKLATDLPKSLYNTFAQPSAGSKQVEQAGQVNSLPPVAKQIAQGLIRVTIPGIEGLSTQIGTAIGTKGKELPSGLDAFMAGGNAGLTFGSIGAVSAIHDILGDIGDTLVNKKTTLTLTPDDLRLKLENGEIKTPQAQQIAKELISKGQSISASGLEPRGGAAQAIGEKIGGEVKPPNPKISVTQTGEPITGELGASQRSVVPFSHETPTVSDVAPFSKEPGSIDNTHEPFTGKIINQLPGRVIQTPQGFHTIPVDQADTALSQVPNENIVTKSPSQMATLGHENLGPVQPNSNSHNIVADETSRFKTGDDIIHAIERHGAGLGFQLNRTEIKQLVDHLSSNAEGNQEVQTWGGKVQVGTIYKPYGSGANGKKDIVIGKVTDPLFSGDSMIVAQINKNGKLDGRFRTHATPVEKKDIITILNPEQFAQLSGETSNSSEAKPQESSDMSDLDRASQEGSVNPGQALDDIKGAIDKFKQNIADSKAGEALRTKYVGNENARIVQDNHLFDSLAHIVKDPIEQEALTLYRNFKDKPGELAQVLNGTHPAYAEAVEEFKKNNPGASAGDIAGFQKSQISGIQKFAKVIKVALNPSNSIRAVDAALDNYFTNKLAEGKKGGFLDSSIDPKTYINQMTTPKAKPKGFVGRATRGALGKKFVHGMQRVFESPLHAVINGYQPKTINAIDLGRIYAQRHAAAAATNDFIRELQSVQLAEMTKDNAPADWKEVKIGTKTVYLPEKLADALSPLVESDPLKQAHFIGNITRFEQLIKAGEVAASVFHYKALAITASNSMTPLQAAKAMVGDMNTDLFKGNEIDFVRHGGTTSELGKTAESYKMANKGTAVTTGDMLRNTPGIKQALALSDEMTRQTFDVAQRKFKVTDFTLQRDAWMAKHPDATAEELSSAKIDIAKYVNNVYGGLNLDTLGWSKLTRGITRALFFAPDWTFSNLLNVKGAFTGGASQARTWKFFTQSAIATFALSQMASLLISGKRSKHPFKVYLGKDKNGKEMYGNWFGVGAFGDLVNELTNVQNQGLITGTAQTVGNKLASLPRSVVHQMTNQNYLHQPITSKGASPVVNTARSAIEAASENIPAPFSLIDSIKYVTDKKTARNFWDYASIVLGTAPTHEIPAGQHVPTTGKDKGKVVPDKPGQGVNRQQNSILDQIKGSPVFKTAPKKASSSRVGRSR